MEAAITYQRITISIAEAEAEGGGSTSTPTQTQRRRFRLHSKIKRFTVSKLLRARFTCLFRVLNRSSCYSLISFQSLKKAIHRFFNRTPDPAECRLRSFRRSNSFYAEAIADCLDFIKRSSNSNIDNHQTKSQFHDSSSPSA